MKTESIAAGQTQEFQGDWYGIRAIEASTYGTLSSARADNGDVINFVTLAEMRPSGGPNVLWRSLKVTGGTEGCKVLIAEYAGEPLPVPCPNLRMDAGMGLGVRLMHPDGGGVVNPFSTANTIRVQAEPRPLVTLLDVDINNATYRTTGATLVGDVSAWGNISLEVTSPTTDGTTWKAYLEIVSGVIGTVIERLPCGSGADNRGAAVASAIMLPGHPGGAAGDGRHHTDANNSVYARRATAVQVAWDVTGATTTSSGKIRLFGWGNP